MITNHKGKSGPPEFVTIATLQAMKFQIKDAVFPANESHTKRSRFPALHFGPSAATLWTLMPLILRHSGENDGVLLIFGGSIFDSFQAKSMVY
jgi:hypothetical protein